MTPSDAPRGLVGRALDAWQQFWFAPTSALPLHITRMALGIAVLGSFLPLAGHVEELFGLTGWFDQRAYAEAAKFQNGPPVVLSWSLMYLAGDNTAILQGLFWAFMIVAALFTAGLVPRLTGVLTWIGVASLTANPLTDTDANSLLLMLSFYLMIAYLLPAPEAGNWRRWLGPTTVWPMARSTVAEHWAYRLPMRILQVHFALTVLTSAFHKLQFGDWWAGVALWCSLYPAGVASVADARAHAENATMYLRVLSVSAYALLAWQLTFPLFAWRTSWRLLLLAGAMIGLVGSWTVLDEPDFGLAFLAGCISFVEASEWRRWFQYIAAVQRRAATDAAWSH